MTATRESILRDTRSAALRTIRLVAAFRDQDMDLRPGEGSFSTAEQVRHICQSSNFMRGLLADAEPTMEAFKREFDVSTHAAALQSLRGVAREVVEAAARVDRDLLQQVVMPFGPDWTEWHRPRAELVAAMIDHESHHRGQLTVYARIARRDIPLLYAPVGDELWGDAPPQV